MKLKDVNILGAMLNTILWLSVAGALILTLAGVVLCFKFAAKMIAL